MEPNDNTCPSSTDTHCLLLYQSLCEHLEKPLVNIIDDCQNQINLYSSPQLSTHMLGKKGQVEGSGVLNNAY